jgi:hypothetical protein
VATTITPTPGEKSGTRDAAARPLTGPPAKRRFTWRPLLRAVHRDVGYVAVGLTFVYAMSGLAVNHIPAWDPNFRNYETAHDLGGPVAGDDAQASQAVLGRLGIRETPKEVYREGDDDLEILFAHRTLHVDVTSGHVVDEGQKPRFLLRVANWLHLNRGKKAWTLFADAYAVGLLFLATSGMFMIAGRKGLLGRGAILVLAGIAIPVLYVGLSGGP